MLVTHLVVLSHCVIEVSEGLLSVPLITKSFVDQVESLLTVTVPVFSCFTQLLHSDVVSFSLSPTVISE